MKKIFIIIMMLHVKLALAQNTEPEIFKVVEQMPEFPGGEQALYKFISDNVRYPDSAIQYNKEARIRVKFVVNETGKITNVSTQSSNVGYGLEAEARRVITLMPDWRPGKNNGKFVKVYFQIPIRFALDDSVKQVNK